VKHGMTDTGAHRSWLAMRERCNYEKNIGYENYGGRGIKVCARWETFENFYADMGDRPDGMTLDRINPEGDYEPGNCRWLTKKEQNRNRRDNVKYPFDGKQRTITEIAELVGVAESTLRARMTRYGYSVQEAVSIPVRNGGAAVGRRQA